MVDSKPEEHIINSAGKCDMPLLTSNATPTSSSVGEEIPVVRDPRLEGLSNQITESLGASAWYLLQSSLTYLDGINAQFSRLCKTGRVLGAELNKQSRMLDCVLAANMERNDVVIHQRYDDAKFSHSLSTKDRLIYGFKISFLTNKFLNNLSIF